MAACVPILSALCAMQGRDMLLRTHITLMAAGGLVLSALGWVGASYLQEQLLEQQITLQAQTAQVSEWANTLGQESRLLDRQLDQMVSEPVLLMAAQRGDKAAWSQWLSQAGHHLSDHIDLQEIAVWRPDAEPVTIWGQVRHGLLDQRSQERVQLHGTADGLRVLGQGMALTVSARRLGTAPESAVLVIARDVRHALQDMAQRTGSSFALRDVRGRLLSTTDAALWTAAEQVVNRHEAARQALTVNARTYMLSSVPVYDVSGHLAGSLVQLADYTQEADARQYLQRLMLLGSGLALLLIVLGLNLYVRHKLRPLERAIDALQALAQGNTEVRLPHTGDDEIGRIGQAVGTFRQNLKELSMGRALRERMRRRQERLLRGKLEQLAHATHQPLQFAAVQNDEEQLRQLARVMNELSGRLIDQHQQLTGMVQELREALISKTRLAGLEQELQIAAQVQLSILPRQHPKDDRLQLHCHITPAREVGGDFYDYFFIDQQHLAFVIADVSGKGVPAALFMTITRTLLKATAQFIAQPTVCLEQLNNLLSAENEQMMFVTLFYGVLNLEDGTVRYVNAGHNPPYVLRRSGAVELVPRTAGIAVAVHEGFTYREGQLRLESGDQLFLFTDGVTEAFNDQSQEYGEPRLERALQLANGCTVEAAPAQVTQAVLDDVHQFENGAPQADDMTCMTIRWMGVQGNGS